MYLQAVLFYIFVAITGVSALAVVITHNIVRSATWLLFALAGTSGIFFLLGAEFIGATQLLIYVGGTLVLVVFGVMLTAQGPFVNMRIGAAEWAIATGVGLLLYGVLAICLLTVTSPRSFHERPMMASRYLGAAFLGDTRVTPKANITGTPNQNSRNRSKIGYLLPFEVVSMHLLVVLIGAAYLARAKRRVR
jgi:NADH-quinone oxidoreductase subunit J